MTLNDLLSERGIDLAQILVMRHRPSEKEFNRILPWLAADRPDLFNAYQETQRPKVENMFRRAKYLASFMGRSAGKALFVGLYRINGWEVMTYDAYRADQRTVDLIGLKMGGTKPGEEPATVHWFDLTVDESFYPEWKGRLVVEWPKPEIAYCRWASTNAFKILAIHEQSVLDKLMPAWDEMLLTWEQLLIRPTRWKEAMAQWRGIYFIHDESDGKGYVGSAYGDKNIDQRWEEYAKTGHGGNSLLKSRHPKNFHFSILQLLSQGMKPDDVIGVERTWKNRLHTRAPAGLNEN